MKVKQLLALGLLISGLTWSVPVDATPLPKFEGAITDSAFMLDSQERARIQDKLQALRAEKGSQIFVVTLKSLHGEAIEEFGQRFFEA